MSDIFIKGLGLAGYRSFGDEIQYMAPFNKINLFIGKNNSGKSNILRFLTEYYPKTIKAKNSNQSEKIVFQDIDQPANTLGDKVIIALCFSVLDDFIENNQKIKQLSPQNIEVIKKILYSSLYTDSNLHSWLILESNYSKLLNFSPRVTIASEIHKKQIITDFEWQKIWEVLTSSGQGHIEHHWIPQTLEYINNKISLQMPTINKIDAIREIKSLSNEDSENISGIGLINKLAKIQHPEYNQQKEKTKFLQINQFLKNVLEDQTAELEIPDSHQTINVNIGEKLLPLEALGTGIHELIILASAATLIENQVLCIEEPEIHLHPNLQRKFLQYLSKTTNNQYFITTHSAHLLDCPEVSIFHVFLNNGCTNVRNVVNNNEKFTICADLGYKASDLLQSNCIIWVEGPSDRIYLNHWIHSIDDSLVEGIHYSIMFYGGRLLSHLTVEDEELKEFISLRKMNRNMCIVIDSDFENETDVLNDTKKRIKKEFSKGENFDTPGFAWITTGREVENYIEPIILEEALCSTHPDAKGLRNSGQFDNCLKTYVKKDGKDSEYAADKIKIAREVVTHDANFDVLDLKEKISNLVTFIQKANR